jgi:hypothetical protein
MPLQQKKMGSAKLHCPSHYFKIISSKTIPVSLRVDEPFRHRQSGRG